MEIKKYEKQINNKKVLIIATVIIAVILLIIFIALNISNSKKGQNNNSLLPKENKNTEYSYDVYKVNNIKFSYANGTTTFTADVTNTSNLDAKPKLLKFSFKDQNEKALPVLGIYIREIKAGETIKLTATIKADITSAKTCEITENK